MARAFIGLGRDKRELRALTSLDAKEIGDAVSVAGTLLIDWQPSTQSLLRQAAKDMERDHATFHRLWLTLKAIANPNESDLVTSEIVATGLPNLTGNIWAALKGQRRTYQTQQVVRVLGVRNAMVRELADENAVEVEKGPSRTRRNVLYDAEDIDELRQKMEATVSLASVANQLDFPCYAVEQLTAMGELTHVPSRALDIIYGQVRLLISSVDDLAAKLTRAGLGTATAVPESSEPWVSLRNAMRIYGGQEKPWGPVVKAITDGSLPCMKAQPVIDSSTLLIRVSDLRASRNLTFDRSQHEFPFAQFISQRDAEELLGISAPTFLEHDLAALLGFKRSGKGSYTSFEAVLRLAHMVVPRTELALRWGIPVSAVGQDPRLNGVEQVAFGWDRQKLIRASGLE
jgi:hypothetical protein